MNYREMLGAIDSAEIILIHIDLFSNCLDVAIAKTVVYDESENGYFDICDLANSGINLHIIIDEIEEIEFDDNENEYEISMKNGIKYYLTIISKISHKTEN